MDDRILNLKKAMDELPGAEIPFNIVRHLIRPLQNELEAYVKHGGWE